MSDMTTVQTREAGVSFVVHVLLGMLDTIDDVKSICWGRQIHVAEAALELLHQVSLTRKNQIIRVVFVSVEDLGLENGSVRDEVYAAGMARGLKLMTPEVAALLRIHYTDQPHNEWVYVAMKPMERADGSLRILNLGRRDIVNRNDALILGASDGRAEEYWSPGRIVAFAQDEVEGRNPA